MCHGHRTRQACEIAHRDRVDHTVSAGRSGCHSTRDPTSWNHRVRGKSGRNRRASEALSARRTIPSSAEDKEAKIDRTLIPCIYMIEFRERFAQALLVHRLDHRTGARVKSGTINLDPADFARSHHESEHSSRRKRSLPFLLEENGMTTYGCERAKRSTIFPRSPKGLCLQVQRSAC